MAENRVIGRNNTLPWRLPSDLERFKALTMGCPLVMGRKTYESIGRALPGRRTIVLTRDRSYAAPDVEIVTSFDDALALVADVDRAFVAGGREVYSHALNVADELYLTVVHEVISGDTRFPHIDFMQWSLLACERHAADTRNAFPHTFLSYERRSRR